MKNLLFILIPFHLFKINNCLAQKDTTSEKKFDRFYISLTGGAGSPMGEFAEYKIQPVNPTIAALTYFYSIAGEARRGITGKLSGYYFFSKHFGCVATGYTGNFKAKEKTADELMIEPLHTVEGVTSAYKTKSWTAGGLMFGMIASAPVSKFVFSIKLLGGLQRSTSPETNLIVTRSNVMTMSIITQNYTQPSVTSSKFGWDAGLDIRITAGKKLNILLSTDYITSHADFSSNILITAETHIYYSGDQVVYSEGTLPFIEKKQISFFSLNAGIAYIFK